jgi:uncharacterized protein YndB with AHSA1/START domain
MSKPSFVYVTYIATTLEKLWQALTDPQLTETRPGVTGLGELRFT